jgi:ParB family chromosome partitioning protein
LNGFTEKPSKVEYIPIAKLELWRSANVRKSNVLQNIEDLASNIAKVGIRVPLLVKEMPKQKYLVFSGQRRLEAAKIAGLSEAPCLIFKTITESEARILSLSENIYRESMTADDLSDAAYLLMQELKSTAEVARRLGVHEHTVKKYLGYRFVHEELKDLVRDHKMTATQAIEVYTKFPEKEKAVKVAKEYSKLKKTEKPRFFKSITLASPSDDINTLHERSKKIKVEKMLKVGDLLFPETDSMLITKLAKKRGMAPKDLIVWIVHQWLEEYERGVRSAA